MTNTLINETQAASRLDAVACILEWMQSMSMPDRERFLGTLSECDDLKKVVVSLAHLARETGTVVTHQESFAERLKNLMSTKQVSQQELAERIGCSQPAISQMLNRMCRPQKRTILRLAEALNVDSRDLWPDIDLADMLDTVASFQQDDYTMTAAEANALAVTAKKNRPKIQAKPLPTHS